MPVRHPAVTLEFALQETFARYSVDGQVVPASLEKSVASVSIKYTVACHGEKRIPH
jgi:hypothetical protein